MSKEGKDNRWRFLHFYEAEWYDIRDVIARIKLSSEDFLDLICTYALEHKRFPLMFKHFVKVPAERTEKGWRHEPTEIIYFTIIDRVYIYTIVYVDSVEGEENEH